MHYRSLTPTRERGTFWLSPCVGEHALTLPGAWPGDKCFSGRSHCVPRNGKSTVKIVTRAPLRTSCLALVQSFHLFESQSPHLTMQVIPRPRNDTYKVSGILQCLYVLLPSPLSPSAFQWYPYSSSVPSERPGDTQYQPVCVGSLPPALLSASLTFNCTTEKCTYNFLCCPFLQSAFCFMETIIQEGWKKNDRSWVVELVPESRYDEI